MCDIIKSSILFFVANFFNVVIIFLTKVQAKSIKWSLQGFLEPVNSNNSKILLHKGPDFRMVKMANFQNCGKIFDKRKMAFWWQNPLEPIYNLSTLAVCENPTLNSSQASHCSIFTLLSSHALPPTNMAASFWQCPVQHLCDYLCVCLYACMECFMPLISSEDIGIFQ